MFYFYLTFRTVGDDIFYYPNILLSGIKRPKPYQNIYSLILIVIEIKYSNYIPKLHIDFKV